MTEETRIDGRNVLITGGGGQLASDLEELLADRCSVRAPNRSELDISEDRAVEAEFERARPDVVFNCAAFHNVEVCEREEDRSFEVNARAVKRLAERCSSVEATLVHLSTNYVFAGDRDAPTRNRTRRARAASTPFRSSPASTPRWPTAPMPWSCEAVVSTASTGAPRRAETSCSACSLEGASRAP